ncbi:MAG: EAL domain-containing protein [Pseudomonas sp.]|uniref:EAL domain-containing protein n=1 Tax=Pseudomonas sp. TaxID=306 RepID=UPI002733AF7B|nr:EAL domain-containing protein [Pseudomonas sp.]MDP3845146.1 EAL domain-containing protein [Pseudomonas sp.]
MEHGHLRKTPVALVIDDDRFMRLLVRETLEQFGLQVEEAADGVTGLVALNKLQPDIVILDVLMPAMSGLEVCRKLRKMAGGEFIPVLMLTGLDDPHSINQAYDAGATDFICKPITSAMLGHRVRYIINNNKLLRAISINEIKLANAQRIAAIGSWEWDIAADQITWSEEIYRIFALAKHELEESYQGFLRHVHAEDQHLVAAAVQKSLGQGSAYSVEHRIIRPNGTERTVHGQGEVTLDQEGQALTIHGTLQDITERKQAEAQIMYLANFDALTQLPNRNLLNDRVAQAISLARRMDQQLAMLCLDLDGFKFINDSFGHAIGDALLKQVATKLQACIRECDTLARVGGDEFVVIIQDLEHDDLAANMAQKILTLLSQPFTVNGHVLHVTTSIGVSVYPGDGVTNDALFKNADTALYSAKAKGRNCIQYYAQEMSRRAEQRMALENTLRMAIERQEFEVYYQPKVDLRSGQLRSVEALVRWHCPGVGLVAPDQFIPLAEELGLIIPIGEWVLRAACAQTKKWHEMGYPWLSVAVNLSARQFLHTNIPELIRQVLTDTGLSAKYLEIELTESLLMNDGDATLKALVKIKDIGVSLALDDFGTGYSSLAYLKRFPFDTLKIDRSFIQDITNNADSAALTKSIIFMANALNLKTVAEGVETEGQLAFLINNQCDAMQGYYFSRPVPSAALTHMLQQEEKLSLAGFLPDKRETLLILDDEALVLSALARIFRHDDYQLLLAQTPAEAFELLALHSVQVIISDQRMPSISGTVFFGQVKKMYPETIRIILSGYTELTSVIDSINNGEIYRFFTKPWDEDILCEQVREAFRHYWLIYKQVLSDSAVAAAPRINKRSFGSPIKKDTKT